MNHRFFVAHPAFCAACAVVSAGVAQAQAQAQTPGTPAAATEERRIVLRESADAAVLGTTDVPGERVIKGAPYCAEAVHENVQWLADGAGGAPNRIVRQQSTRLCRDGEGRTRQELDHGGRKLVYLRDPVARENWVLDTDRKTARRTGSGPSMGDVNVSIDTSAMREFAERMREWARSVAEAARGAVRLGDESRHAAPAPLSPLSMPTPPTPPVPPTPVVPPVPAAPVLIEPNDDPSRSTGAAEVRVLRLASSTQPGSVSHSFEWPAPPPGVSWRAQALAPRGPGSTSPLPARDMEGLRANGERTSWVIEAGKMGNEKPITIVREVWTSPELMLTLLTRDFDPRQGEVSYRLRNIKRGEPEAALMRVPAEFSKSGVRKPAARDATKDPSAGG